MRSEKGMKAFAWIMLGAIVFGLGGYGVTNFGGGLTSIGTVGDQQIPIQEYSKALSQELDTYRAQYGKDLTAAQALQLGIDGLVQQRLVVTAALDNEDNKLGISIGNKALRSAIEQIAAFHGLNGGFDMTAYKFALQQNGLSTGEFETNMRKQLSREILQTALTGTVPAPAEYVTAVSDYAGERRGFSLLKITAADLQTPVPAPTEAELKAYYEAHKPDFTAPEAKVITYAALTPDMLAGKIAIDDKTLQELYDKNKAQFESPETRTVERLVYPDMAAAQAAKAELDAGKKTFDQLVAERGLKAADIALGPVTEADLSKQAGPVVFALQAPGVAGPEMSSLGPALFRVTAITPGKSTSFDEAKPELGQSLKLQKAQQEISDQVETINDKLAGGATLQDLVKETPMQLGHLDFTAGDSAGMAAYPAFRTAAEKVKAGDYPTLIQLKDGGIAALQLDKVRPAALIPFDKVADKVKAGWTAEATAKALKARAEEIAKAVQGGADLAGFGKVETVQPVTRTDFIDGAPKTLLTDLFKLKAPGELATAEAADAAFVAKLEQIQPADPKDNDVAQMRAALESQAAQGIADDGFNMFATGVLRHTKISLDKAAIAAVNAQFH